LKLAELTNHAYVDGRFPFVSVVLQMCVYIYDTYPKFDPLEMKVISKF